MYDNDGEHWIARGRVPEETKVDEPNKTLLRLRTRVTGWSPEDIELQLKTQAGILGAIVAYAEGDYVISLHEDTKPTLPDSNKARRVRAEFPDQPPQTNRSSNATVVDSGAMKMALNVLRRAGKDEVADALAATAVR